MRVGDDVLIWSPFSCLIPSKCIDLKRIDRSQRCPAPVPLLFCVILSNKTETWLICLQWSFETLFSKLNFDKSLLGAFILLFQFERQTKKVNFRTVMVQPWGVELCNFPIWYDKGIIDLVTLISNLLLHWRIKKRFSAPCFSTFFTCLCHLASPLTTDN